MSERKGTRKKKTKRTWVIKQTEPIAKYYKLGRQIGQPGQFGHAVQATNLKTGEKFAVKVISKARFSGTVDQEYHFGQLRAEIAVMKKMDHPNIIKLYDVFESKTELFIVMEECSGGELFDRIKDEGYSEKDAASVLREMFLGIEYMHQKKIAHCDLKPDNFLFLNEKKTAPLKIIDFGMSKFVQRRKYFDIICGTPYYVAPEVIQGKYSEHCDMWSLGVVMFVMLFGYPPFYADQEKYGNLTDDKIFQLVQKGFANVTKSGYGAHFPKDIACSASAKDLIAKLLTLDTASRLTATEALEHPWLLGQTATNTPIASTVLSNLKSFHGSCKMKDGILGLMVDALTDTEVEELKKSFKAIDKDNSGTISFDELRAAMKEQKLTVNTKELEQLMKAADVDGDGQLSYDELVRTCVQRKLSAKEERLWDTFCKLDLDGDGTVSEAEIAKVLCKGDMAEARKLLAEVDENHDGNVDYEEFIAMWTKKNVQT